MAQFFKVIHVLAFVVLLENAATMVDAIRCHVCEYGDYTSSSSLLDMDAYDHGTYSCTYGGPVRECGAGYYACAKVEATATMTSTSIGVTVRYKYIYRDCYSASISSDTCHSVTYDASELETTIQTATGYYWNIDAAETACVCDSDECNNAKSLSNQSATMVISSVVVMAAKYYLM